MNRSLVGAPRPLVSWSTIAITLLLLFGADSASAIVAAKVVAGGAHSCELVPNGTVRCWGKNESGQLGTGDNVDHYLPTTIAGLTGVSALTAGSYHTCALVGVAGQGNVVCWGNNNGGQLGAGDNSSSNVPKLVLGMGSAGETIAVAAGSDHTCALRSDATVRCWGRNSSGQLGIGPAGDSNTPQLVVGITGVVTAIATGAAHTCAVKSDGKAACWGNNNHGQLGIGSTVDNATPQAIPGLSGITAIAAGAYHTCARLSDAKVRCWGQNSDGQLGAGNYADTSTPPVTSIALSSVTAISAGNYHTCAVTMAGSAWCWGQGHYGQLGNGLRVSLITPQAVLGLSAATAIGSGAEHTCAAQLDGRIACWGSNTSGQLGIGAATGNDQTIAHVIPGLAGQVAVTAGAKHTCTVSSVLGIALCWGNNGYGQLGTGNYTASNTAKVVSGPLGATSVAAGYHHTCAVMTNGPVKCWGYNTFGQLGTGDYTDWNTPTVVAGGLTGLIAVAAGRHHTCALASSGFFRVECWGVNDKGQLGNAGAGGSSNVPVIVGGLPSGVAAIAAGEEHTCALTSTGKVRCWGSNQHGQLGTGDNMDTNSPAPEIAGLTNVTAIAAGGSHTCALKLDQTVRCWGRDTFGQLGTGNQMDSSTPQPVVESAGGAQLTNVTAIAAGRYHTCALTLGGTVQCWGENNLGQLGTGNQILSSTPKLVVGLSSEVTAIAAGSSHTCALLSDQTLACWGEAYDGQLGNGEFGYNSLPLITEGLFDDGYE